MFGVIPSLNTHTFSENRSRESLKDLQVVQKELLQLKNEKTTNQLKVDWQEMLIDIS